MMNEPVKIQPAPTNAAFRNPMKGFREFFDVMHVKRPEYPLPFGSLIKEYMQWRKIERYAGDGVAQVIAYSNHRWKGYEAMNIKVIPRVYLHWPGSENGAGHADGLTGLHWPADMTSGDYNSGQFRDRAIQLIRKLGEAWNNDPRVAYVEMGIIGEWAEHHNPDINDRWLPHEGGPHVAGETWLPGMDRLLGDAFRTAFPHKKVMVRYAYDFNEYDFGIYWDSWGTGEELERGYKAMLDLGDRWKTQPIGGEVTWNWGSYYFQFRETGFAGILKNEAARRHLINTIRELHCNHMGGVTWTDFSDPDTLAAAAEVQRHMGYRFELRQVQYSRAVQPGNLLTVSFQVVNTGSSPFYYDWPVEISLLLPASRQKVWTAWCRQAKTSRWLPGDNWDRKKQQYLQSPQVYTVTETGILDRALPAGRYLLALSIVDPAGMQPALRFATAQYFKGGRHPVGYIDVGPASTEPLQPDATLFDDLYNDLSLYYAQK